MSIKRVAHNKKSHNQFESEFYSLFGMNDFVITGMYTGNKNKIRIRHLLCNKEIERRPNTFFASKKLTCDCMRHNIKHTHEYFSKKFFFHNSPDKFRLVSMYDSALGIEQNVDIECRICNNVFTRTAHQTYQGIRCDCQIKKYHVNDERYFRNIDTNLKAYFLGFIMADGSVEDFSSKSLRIKINNIDEELLVKFLEEIDSDHIIENKHYREDKIFSQIRVNNNFIFDDLSQYGIIPNKTMSVNPPLLNNDLLKFYYLGLWDGDGGISYSMVQNKNKKDHKTFKIYLTGTKSNVYGFNKFLMDNGLVNKLYKTHPSSFNGEIIKIVIGGNNKIKKIMDFMYKDSEFHLSRKYKKYLILKNINKGEE